MTKGGLTLDQRNGRTKNAQYFEYHPIFIPGGIFTAETRVSLYNFIATKRFNGCLAKFI